MSSVENLSEKAYQHIRRQVFSGRLAAGDRLVNRTLANELGTSFIPIREALSRLASEGMIRQVPGAGAFVREFDRQEVSEIYDIRRLNEPFAAAEAARMMSDHELDELKVILKGWQELGDAVLKHGPTESYLDRWLGFNEQFHHVMISAARNRYLSKITTDLQVLSHCFAVQRGSPSLLSDHLVRTTLESHQQLINHFEKRDSEQAEALVRDQLRFGKATVLGFFDQGR